MKEISEPAGGVNILRDTHIQALYDVDDAAGVPSRHPLPSTAPQSPMMQCSAVLRDPLAAITAKPQTMRPVMRGLSVQNVVYRALLAYLSSFNSVSAVLCIIHKACLFDFHICFIYFLVYLKTYS